MSTRILRAIAAAAALLGAAVPAVPAAAAPSTTVVISEFRVRGSLGGNDEFVELYNKSSSPISLTGWKINGSNNAGTTSTRVTIGADKTIQPGCYFLLTNVAASGFNDGATPDATYSVGITDDGGLALLDPTNAVIDAAGMSAGSAYKEGTPLASLGLSNLDRGYERKPGGAAGATQDTDDNSADFQLIDPSTPQNTASTCTGGPTGLSGVGAADPSTVERGNATLLTVDVTPATDPDSTDIAVVGDLTSIGGTDAQAFSDDGANGDETAGDGVFSYEATVDAATAPGGKTLPTEITDGQDRSASAPISLTVTAPAVVTPIHTIQGTAHLSPLAGQSVTTSGIVTAIRSNGFFVEDPAPDVSDATSEGIFVFTSSAPTVAVGNAVQVTGTVQEFRPGGATSGNLTTTELGSPTVSVVSTGNALPLTTVGPLGRTPPAAVIDDDATGDVETSGSFDAATDGIDFWESLEGMRLQLPNAVAVGPTTSNGEVALVTDDASAGLRTPRGGIVIQPTDFNPERLITDDAIVPAPVVDVGDHFAAAPVGVLDYSFGNFKLLLTAAPTVVPGGLARDVTEDPVAGELSVGTFNVENLDPNDPQAKFDGLADLIVDNLKAPDLLALEEIQDDNGPTNDATVSAGVTFTKLIQAIAAAGGPTYQFREIDPVDDQDGGEPGGNIRVGFLFRTDRGLAFTDRAGGGPTTATIVKAGPKLSASPGRIDPANAAFTSSRKPLAAEFTYGGRKLFVIANHFNSKGGDQPLFGSAQPPQRISETQRHQQAAIVNAFVDAILARDANARIVVLGDLNDFQFSDTLQILEGGVLTDLLDTLPAEEQYTYVFEGNSQALDHILLSDSLAGGAFEYDPLHINSEFHDQLSDHDPQVLRLPLATPFTFTGFFAPVNNRPVRNVVTAGAAVPVRFSLAGDRGLDVILSVKTGKAGRCGGVADDVEETIPTTGPSLTYDAGTDTYTYRYVTRAAWAGECRGMTIKFADGTKKTANFRFTS